MNQEGHLPKEEVVRLYHLPLIELMHRAAEVHRKHFKTTEIQVNALVSVKTGGCTEDCSYCAQSARYETKVKVHGILPIDIVEDATDRARERGVSRMCLSAAWREVRNNADFDKILDMVHMINNKGLEVCCTLGMLTQEQADKLAEAGLYAYNHNIDTSPEHYEEIIGTRTFDDRISTLKKVRKAGITVCSGGIIGMGESDEDRISMLYHLASLKPQPESVPINALVPIEGTPLGHCEKVSSWELIRMVAMARILLPHARVRLSAGRVNMSHECQALCFMCGANSIFAGDKLLTTPNPNHDDDDELFKSLGIHPLKPKESNQPVN